MIKLNVVHFNKNNSISVRQMAFAKDDIISIEDSIIPQKIARAYIEDKFRNYVYKSYFVKIKVLTLKSGMRAIKYRLQSKDYYVMESFDKVFDLIANRESSFLKGAANLLNDSDNKIPEDSVIIMEKEFWKLSNKFSKKELDEIVEFHKKKARKQVVKDFAERLKEKCNALYVSMNFTNNKVQKSIDEIAKELGLEVEE